MSNDSVDFVLLKNGYDLPIYGLDDGSFYALHITAISCLVLSVICAVITVIFSFIMKSYQTFFAVWNKRDRLVVYMAICDGLFHVCHLADHVNVLIVKDHVHPKSLCVFYAFFVSVIFLVENLLVNFIAINAFALLYFERNLHFGKRDWKVLVWIIFIPVTCGVVTLASDKYGPTGAYCMFDGVTGSGFMFALFALPVMIILPTNATLYVLIWIKLYVQMKKVKRSLGHFTAGMMASRRAAKSMALFVAAYIIQWWPVCLVSVLGLANTSVPQAAVQLNVIFVNLGGTLNLLVFLIIKRTMSNVQPLPSQTGNNVSNVTGL